MKPDCSKFRILFPEAFYGELDHSAKMEFERHLKWCKSCNAEYEQFRHTAEIMSKKKSADPGAAYWDNYWQNLESRMRKDGVYANKSNPRKVLRLPEAFPKWMYRIVSAAAILLIGVGLGFLLFTESPPPFSEKPATGVSSKQAVLNRETASYLENSKLLLLGFINFDTDQVDPSTMDFSRQQEQAKSLIRKTAVLKDDLKGKENQRVLDLIRELEILLLQISNYEKEFNIPAIDLIKSGVDNSSIMMKINIEELIRVAESEGSAAPEKKNKIQL